MKFTSKTKSITLLFLCSFSLLFAQPKKQKIDGVAAVVGDFVVLESDIDLLLIEFRAQGISTKDISRCEVLGKLLEDKLYAHHAIQDSIIVTDSEVRNFMNEQLSTMVEQLGSMEKVVKYYNKKSEEDLKNFFFDIVKMNKLTSQMQRKIVDEIEITPEEVRQFFRSLKPDEIPQIGAEVELAQIVIRPEISQKAKQEVIDKLNQIRTDVLENGASFTTKAVLYSEDKGSVPNGGYYKINRKTQFVKEFKDVAFSLAPGQISEPFATEFGYHIILVEKILGQDIELRHILLSPKVSDLDLKVAKEKLELIRTRILNNEISFSDAAKTLSDQKETKNNGGILLNPKTLEPRFELAKIDPSLYNDVENLKEGEISKVLIDEEQGKGKFYKIITINKKTTEHIADFSADFMKIKQLALDDKKVNAIGKWSEEKIKETYIKINGEYRNCEFTNNWLKK